MDQLLEAERPIAGSSLVSPTLATSPADATMQSINHFNLRSFDLNLLVAFDAMMQERNVTRAAERLRVRQPTMSYNLNALRLLFQDELFVRVGQVMQPTVRALALAGAVRQVLSGAQEALNWNESFDPANETRTFSIGMTGELELLVFPELTRRWRSSAPGIRFHARHVEANDVRRSLDDGVVDLVIGCGINLESWHRAEALISETVRCCFNPGLLPIQPPISVQDYTRLPHVTVTFGENLAGCLEAELVKADVRLNVVSACSNFLAALAAVAQAPVLTTIPTSVAMRYSRLFDLVTSDIPIAFDARDVSMAWHARAERDPGASWLREQIRQAVVSQDGDEVQSYDAAA